MEKTVIYKTCFGFECTTESNYKSLVSDARKVHKMHDFLSVDEIISYYCKHFGATPDGFIIVG